MDLHEQILSGTSARQWIRYDSVAMRYGASDCYSGHDYLGHANIPEYPSIVIPKEVPVAALAPLRDDRGEDPDTRQLPSLRATGLLEVHGSFSSWSGA